MTPSEERFRQLACERLKFKVASTASLRWLKDYKFDVAADYLADNILAVLTARFLGRRVQSEERETPVAEVPLDWWQAFRARWFPAWWLARWPVRMRQIYAVTARYRYHVCPHFDLPPGNNHVYFLAYENPPAKWWEE